MKRRLVGFGIVFYFAVLFMVIFPMLIPGSLQYFCRQSCCYKFDNHQQNNVMPAKDGQYPKIAMDGELFEGVPAKHCCSSPIPAEKGCMENSPMENTTPLKCPLEVCCQPSELPTHLSFSFEFQREKESHASPGFVKMTFLCGIFFSADNGIFSIPLKRFFEHPKLPLYLKNRILIV